MLFGIGMNFGVSGDGGGITIDLPTDGGVQDLALGDDLDVLIAVATASTSRLLVSLRRCVNSSLADIELDNVTGLLRVVGVESPSAAAGSVAWAAQLVTVHVAADAFKALRPGDYMLTLEELTVGGRRLLKHSRLILLYRTGGGLRG